MPSKPTLPRKLSTYKSSFSARKASSPGRIKFEITFKADGDTQTWERFAANEKQARSDVERALDREYPTGYKIISIKEAAMKLSRPSVRKAARIRVGDRVRISEGSGLDSNKTGVVVPLKEVGTDGRGIPKIDGHYKPLQPGWSVVRLDKGGYTTMPNNRLYPVSEKAARPAMRKAGASKVDFRTTKPQVVNDYGEERTVVYVGKDPITGTSLYGFDLGGGEIDGGDPRGMLGVHATDFLVAREYKMQGPDIAFSWMTLNDNQERYKRAVDYAKSKWTDGAAKAARSSTRKTYAPGIQKIDVDPAVRKAGDYADKSGYNVRMKSDSLTIMGAKVEQAKKFLRDLADKFSLKQEGNNVVATLSAKAAAARARMSKAEGDEPVATRVTFRRWTGKQGKDVIALLWDVDAQTGRVMMYEHVGQHGEGDVGIVNRTKAAAMSESDVKDLYDELTGLGYKLTVVQRQPADAPNSDWGKAARPAMRKAGGAVTKSDIKGALTKGPNVGKGEQQASGSSGRYSWDVVLTPEHYENGQTYGIRVEVESRDGGGDVWQSDSPYVGIDFACENAADAINEMIAGIESGDDYEAAARPAMRKASPKKPTPKIAARLKYLRGKIESENISYMEIAELQGLADYIDDGDVQLLEWAGVEEGERGQKAARPVVLKSLSELKRIAIVEPDPRVRAGYAEELAKRMTKAGEADYPNDLVVLDVEVGDLSDDEIDMIDKADWYQAEDNRGVILVPFSQVDLTETDPSEADIDLANGVTLIPHSLHRFSEEDGFYHA